MRWLRKKRPAQYAGQMRRGLRLHLRAQFRKSETTTSMAVAGQVKYLTEQGYMDYSNNIRHSIELQAERRGQE